MTKPSIILLAATLVGVVFSAFRGGEADSETPVQVVKRVYHQDMVAFSKEVAQLDALAKGDAADPQWTSALQAQLLTARLAFKRFEYLVAHLDPQGTKDHINGAPLPALERHAPSPVVLEPEGLQVLDELIFSDHPAEHQPEITELTKTLKSRFKAILQIQTVSYLADRNIFEAIRFELVRSFTLGLTGFDSPSSSQSIPEAQAAFERIHQAARLYYPWLAHQPALRQEVEAKFEGAIAYLQANQDFDSFDRLTFLRDYVEPLYGLMLDFHLATGFETIGETTTSTQSVNYLGRGFFSTDLFNPYHFTTLTEKQDNEHVRLLGQTLFFDPVMSKNYQRSCASCHDPEKAFTDGKTKSLALDFEGDVERNSPTLINSVFADRYFHDLRSDRLENQAEHVIVNEKEFDMTVPKVMERLQQSDEYVALFKSAFPNVGNPINKNAIGMALESYVMSLQSFNSPFDQYVRGESDEISPEIRGGFNLFMGKASCGTCHFPPTFAGLVPPDFHDSESEVLGVPAEADTLNATLDPDLGRYKNGRMKEHAEFYRNAFKTPTVRNIELTAPYMHNGVYATLEEVVDFYNRGGGTGLGLDVPNQTLPPDRLDLTQSEQAALIAFMKSLNDSERLTGAPQTLPQFAGQPEVNGRKIGGTY